ncbi:MAG: hypothetical protein JXB04_04545 [Kiritimatiellae bacterium]|nr:hypothetical protein [Kiritimatiellia bacterium]
MDLLAHALYGATACSRSGLAGGRKGRGGGRLFADWTVWCAVLFGVLPDLVSMGIPFLLWMGGAAEHFGYFFRDFGGQGLVLYRYVHSLLVALLAAGLLRLTWKPLFIPSLAWVVHIVTDALTHDLGKFRTMLFYPLSDWAFEGWPWWRHAGVRLTYWLILPATWLVLWALRRGQAHPGASHVKGQTGTFRSTP